MKTLLLALMLFAQQSAVPGPQAGTITGRLTALDGSPGRGVRISAVMVPNQGGAGTESLIAITETDELGRYRLENLPPGNYRVIAGLVAFPTYHPGVAFPSAATVVAIRRGAVVVGMDFRLVRPVSLAVSGRIIAADGADFSRFRVTMSQAGQGGSFAATVGNDGTFTFLKVTPGSYSLLVWGGGNSFGMGVTITDSDLKDVQLNAIPALVGRVVVEEGNPLPGAILNPSTGGDALKGNSAVTVEAAPLAGLSTIAKSTVVGLDGVFSFVLATGQYRLQPVLPLGYYLKAVTYGADASATSIEISDSAPPAVTIVLTRTPPNGGTRGVTVRGQIIGVDGREDIFAALIGPRATGSVRTDSRGMFEFVDVPPGDYGALAFGPGLSSASSTNVPVVVKGQDIAGVNVPLSMVVSGHATVVDLKGNPVPGGLTGLKSLPVISLKSPKGILKYSIKADGEVFVPLWAGDYEVAMENLPLGYRVRSISSNGQDLRKIMLKVDMGVRDIEIVIESE